jgi:hypothetical protein
MHSLKLDYEKDLSSILTDANTSVDSLLKDSQKQEISDDVAIANISNELLGDIIQIFN